MDNDLVINLIAAAIYSGIEMGAHSLALSISDPEKQELGRVTSRAFVKTFEKLLAEINDDNLRSVTEGYHR